MDRREQFGEEAVDYLANLCHDCRACYYACPYVPPHEFSINIPKILAEARLHTYRKYAWPRLMAIFFNKGRTFSLTLVNMVLVIIVAIAVGSPQRILQPHLEQGSFYSIFTYNSILTVGLSVGMFIVLSWMIACDRFWTAVHGSPFRFRLSNLAYAAKDAFSHRWFKGGGSDGHPGCYYPGQQGSYIRLVFHSMTFFGFLLAVISTTIAAFNQDILGLLPPYPILSLAVLFGIIGGALMTVGASALLYLKFKSDRTPSFAEMIEHDYAFLTMINLVSITGILLLILRNTTAMGILFIVHMGFVLSLFLLIPYGKFIHLLYRFAALTQNRIEERRTTSGQSH